MQIISYLDKNASYKSRGAILADRLLVIEFIAQKCPFSKNSSLPLPNPG